MGQLSGGAKRQKIKRDDQMAESLRGSLNKYFSKKK